MDTSIELSSQISRQGVLVVDDSAVQRRCSVELLQHLGVKHCYEAVDGEDALQLLRNMPQPPAVMLLDLEMPGMDGIETAQQLQHLEHCPAILLASSAESSVLNAVAGMAQMLGLPLLGTVRKPFSLQALELLLARFEAPQRKADTPPLPAAVTASALQQALQSGQIIPYYQPKMRLGNGEVDGLEALARWRQADGQLVPPLRFIPVAEQHGLIDELTLLVLEQVLVDMQAWQATGFRPGVSINVSAPSLSDRGFGNAIIERVAAANIPPSAIVLEITESALMGDLAAALGTLGRLRLKGFGLSIDDYGTGFSSMQQLSRLPFSELKLDGAFVRYSPEKWQLRTILEAAVSMGQGLGLTTVGEGVETAAELRLLRELGCEYAQGYLIAAPMPVQRVLPWLASERHRLRALCCS